MSKVGGVGVPRVEENLPPVVLKNYGKWDTHEIVKPGVIKRVSKTGDVCHTVRTAMPPSRISVASMLELCDLADKYSGGYFRITLRHSFEFIVVVPKQINALIKEVEALGFPVGGTRNSMHNIMACPSWIHCNLPATDSPSIAKVLGDALIKEFKNHKLPSWLKINIGGCANIEEALMADIGIIGVHRDLPIVLEDQIGICERPTVIAICPTAAIKPKGEFSVSISAERCIHCGACTMHCEAILTGDPKLDGYAISVGGKASNTGSGPDLGRIVIPYLPNNPPKWQEAVKAVVQIMDAWRKDAEPDERMREWINRIGWDRFFRKAGIKVSLKDIDGYIYGNEFARSDLRFGW
ncbi:MAG: dissimilatory-type sulfite reductase subunit beta [Nitrospirae bacterium]|nr:dissimilatory-type sulfite reductase subunit beta [Nitrospirota bacterium]